VDGNISVKFKGCQTDRQVDLIKSLPKPYFYNVTQNCFDPGEFIFILEQRLPEELVKQLTNWPDKAIFIFDFDELNIMVQSAKESQTSARLPLWNLAEVAKQDGRLITYRSFKLGLNRPRLPATQ
jgi:hypothetical protein